MKILRNIKSIIMYSILLVFCVGVGLVCTACGDQPQHEHSVSAWTVTRAATCTEEGLRTGKCDGCGEEFSEAIAKIPHTEVTLKGTEATCEKDGLTDGKICGVCHTTLVKQQVIHALGHQPGNYQKIEGGVSDNGHEVDDSFTFHTWTCQRCGYVEENERCTYENIVVPATCEQDGYTIHKCLYCPWEFEHDKVEKTGHRYQEGVYTYVGNIGGEHQHKQVCLNGCGVDKVEACDVDDFTVEPSCTAKGYTRHTCNKCKNAYETDVQPMLQHNYGEGDVWKPVEGDNFYHQKTCLLCGRTERQRCSDKVTIKAATCTEARQIIIDCDVCHKHNVTNNGEPLGHKLDIVMQGGTTQDDCYHYYKCSRAGCDEESEHTRCVFTHDASKATCESDGHDIWHCEECLRTFEETETKLNHAWGPWKPNADGTMCQSVCENDPTHIKTKPHEYDTEVTQYPDCVTAGSTTYTCRDCEHKDVRVIEALGHDYDPKVLEWDVNDEGHRRKCTRLNCGHEEELTRHIYTESNICECGYDGLEYTQVEGHYVVSGASKLKNQGTKKIIIPETYKGLPVTELGIKGTSLFGYFSSILELVLSNNLEKIEEETFVYCSRLTNVYINTDVGEDVEPKLKEICSRAFYACIGLKVAHFPDSLQIIGNNAFYNCTNLSDIVIPKQVLDIGDDAFGRTAYYNDPNNWRNNVLYISGHLIKANNNISSEYEVEAGTVNICSNAFTNCTALEKITIPGSVIEIDRDAFYGCTSLSSVNFTGTFDEWLHLVFANNFANPMYYANSLTIPNATGAIIVPDGTTRIPAGTFKNSKITSVYIPASVTEIGENAFYNCSSLTAVTFHENCKIKRIGKDAFTGCSVGNWEDGVLYIGKYLIAVNEEVVEGKDIVVAAGTLSIAENAFTGNIKSIKIAESVGYIGARAFEGCISSLQSVTFENPNGWMAFNVGGAGRGVISTRIDGSNPESSIEAVRYYVGMWVKNISSISA